jgi:hypothetical protein
VIIQKHRQKRSSIVLWKKQEKGDAQDILSKLNNYLNTNSKEPIQWLTRFLSDLPNAITYKELREAIMAGQISENTVREWQNAYSHVVATEMNQVWKDATIAGGNSGLQGTRAGFYYDPTTESARNWIHNHGGEWVTQTVQDQRDAINAMIQRGYSGAWTVDELARAIRPVIGLALPQADANLNYYKHIKTSLLEDNPTMRESTAEKRAREASLKYAARQHRQRAYTIATTEMAFAYNKGADEGILQAQKEGYLGTVKRVWCTAEDELVCDICGSLNGLETEMDEEFDFKGKSLYRGQKKTPPAHPRCRCGCRYEEVSPPVFENIKLAYDEEGALKRYISSDSYRINEKLRDNISLLPEDIGFMTNIDVALSRMPQYVGTLTRSLQFINDEDHLSFLQQHTKGSIIEYGQYISTTKGAVYNPGANVQIVILRAKSGRDISAYNPEEQEVVYERNSLFTILSVTETEDGTIVITMEEAF